MVKFENIEVVHCENKGRGIQATCRILPGEELIAEKPLVYTLINSKSRGNQCDHCFKSPENLLRCSKCKFVSYCNQKCQAGDWPVHKQECKCLVKVAPRQPPDIIRLISQLLFKCNGKNESANLAFRSSINNLVSNEHSVPITRKEAFFTFGAILQEYLQDTKINLEDTDIFGLFCRISCNSFSITNAELNSLGTGVYKTASMINHSCDPNCIALFNGPDISVRSIKEIAAGEELLMTYVSLTSPLEVRQSDLKEGYMFECKCLVCIGQQFNDFLMKSFKCEGCPCFLSLSEKSELTESRVCSCDKKCVASNDYLKKVNKCSDELEALYNAIKVIPTPEQQAGLKEWIQKSERVLGASNISLVHCYEVAMDGCLDCDDWKGALDYGKKLEKPYHLYHSKFHPTIGLHYFKLGKLEILLGNLREGISYYQKSMKVLLISHGEQDNLVKMLRDTLNDACMDMANCERYDVIERIYNEMGEE